MPTPLRAEGTDEALFLHTHLIVGEDLLALYGFENLTEREYFVLLLGVNGVGPKIALAILSLSWMPSGGRLSEQADVFSRVPGVGKKNAQKILLHLRVRFKGEGIELWPGNYRNRRSHFGGPDQPGLQCGGGASRCNPGNTEGRPNGC